MKKANYDMFGIAFNKIVPITKIAEQYEWTGAKLNSFLKEHGVIRQDERSGSWVLTDIYKDKKYAVSRDIVNRDGKIGKTFLSWTKSGREFIYNLMKDELDLLPNNDNTSSDVKVVNNDFPIVEDSDGCISILDFVHILSMNRILVGGRIPHRNNVFETLREKGFLNKTRGLYWNTPYRDFDSFGYFKVIKKRTPRGGLRYVTQLTPKGQSFFLRYFKKLMDEKDSIYGEWDDKEG